MIRLLGKQLRSRKPRPRSLKTDRKNSMSADNLDLSRVQHSVWDTGRRYGETRNPDSPGFSLLINRTVFTPRKDPLRPPPVLATDGSREAPGASPRKRLSGQLCSRPLQPALLSPRKLVSPDQRPLAEPGGISSPSSLRLLPAYRPLVPSTIARARRQVQRARDEKFPSGISSKSSPPSLPRMLPAYRPLIPSTIMRARRQVQRVRDEKSPSVYSSRFSPDAPTNVSAPETHHPDWSPVFMNPVYRSPPHKIARTMTGPAAYAPVLVQRTLTLGTRSPEAETRAGKASSSNSSSINGVDVV